jgi:hypothetical protein
MEQGDMVFGNFHQTLFCQLLQAFCPVLSPILFTEVIISEVASPCILSRLMINALGRPGIDTDMEVMSGGDRCIICWTQPQLSLDAVKAKLERVIYQ